MNVQKSTIKKIIEQNKVVEEFNSVIVHFPSINKKKRKQKRIDMINV